MLTDKGLVRGVETDTMREFLGIPFAAPPVGERRWQAPAPSARWEGIRDASQVGPHCAQPASPFGTASVSEDCLYLNVFTPRDRFLHRDFLRGHPVMVWLHGGALLVGESDEYDPSRLVERGDVVVVTINYRLGALGFLTHPALSAEAPEHVSGNYGLLDQQAALRWVQRNIARFGGDPRRVTIFGESAGALSVQSQLISPRAAGLFHRAIAESGSYLLAPHALATAETRGQAFATQAGCPDQSAACLRALPVETLLANQGSSGGIVQPTVDGVVLPQTIADGLASGQFNHVPVLQGSNHDEWTLFVALRIELVTGPVTADRYQATIAGIFGIPLAAAAPLVAQYPLDAYATPGDAVGALLTDATFACGSRRSALLLSGQVPTFAYEFNDLEAPQRFLPPVSFTYGAYHAGEVQYVFDITSPFPAQLDPDQLELAEAIADYWTTFARTGQPNTPSRPFWPRLRSDSEEFLSLETGAPVVETDFAADHQCAFWAALGR